MDSFLVKSKLISYGLDVLFVSIFSNTLSAEFISIVSI